MAVALSIVGLLLMAQGVGMRRLRGLAVEATERLAGRGSGVNDGPMHPEGLLIPRPAPIVVQDGVDYRTSGPGWGEVHRASLFQVTLNTDLRPGAAVRFIPKSSNGDGRFDPPERLLDADHRTGTFSYTPTRWGRRTISFTNEGGLRAPAGALEFVAKVQIGASGTAPSGNQSPDLGGFDLFDAGPWWREMGRQVVDDPTAPDSAQLLQGFGEGKIRVDWSTTTARGGNSMYGIPYNVVSGEQPGAPIALGSYIKESDPGPAPFFRGMSVEGWYSATGEPPSEAKVKDGGDHHGLVARRDEANGGIDRLYEYYQVSSSDEGKSWQAAGGSQFDLTTGAPRPSGWTSSDAAGLPIIPLLVRYDEAASGVIRHPFRVAVSPGLSRNRFVWPARHAVLSGSHEKGLAMGARLRLSERWFLAHRDDFRPIARTVVDAMRSYGVIVADLADNGLWLCGVNDERWDDRDLQDLRTIPASAFEVVDTLRSPIRFHGPVSGAAGRAMTFTIQHDVPGDSNFQTNVYLYQSSDGGKTWSHAGWAPEAVTVDDEHRGPLQVTFTPGAAKTYLLKADPYLDWIEPSLLTFKAGAQPVGRRRQAPRR